jgi:hypothetical protein
VHRCGHDLPFLIGSRTLYGSRGLTAITLEVIETLPSISDAATHDVVLAKETIMFSVWHKLLLLSLAGQVLLGIGLTVAGTSALFAPLNDGIAADIWGNTGAPEGMAVYQQFALGVMGAVTAGWGVTGLFLAWFGIGRQQRWAWWALAEGVTVWFVLDTGLCLWLGVTTNVLFNTVLAILLAVPLAGTYRGTSNEPAASRLAA